MGCRWLAITSMTLLHHRRIKTEYWSSYYQCHLSHSSVSIRSKFCHRVPLHSWSFSFFLSDFCRKWLIYQLTCTMVYRYKFAGNDVSCPNFNFYYSFFCKAKKPNWNCKNTTKKHVSNRIWFDDFPVETFSGMGWGYMYIPWSPILRLKICQWSRPIIITRGDTVWPFQNSQNLIQILNMQLKLLSCKWFVL